MSQTSDRERSFLRTYTRPRVFGSAVIAALLLGVLAGAIARSTETAWLSDALDAVGSTFTTLLQLAVLPLVFTAIVVGINSLRQLGGGKEAARLGGKTVLWFAITSFIAVLIGIAVGLLIDPGAGGLNAAPTEENTARAAESVSNWGSWWSFLESLIPGNVVAAFAEGGTLQVVFLAVIAGAAAYSLGERAKPFVDLNASVFEIVQRYLRWIVLLAPLGVFGLIGAAVATYGDELFRPLASATLAVYAGTLLVLFVVYPILLRLVAKVSPARFFSKAWTTLQFAFASQSSGATLPLTRQTAVNLGVPPAYAGFAVPLASTTKMDGCAAVFPAVGVIFIANISGITLSIGQYAGIVAAAVFGALATAGTTGWLTALTLSATVVGLPPEQIALGIALFYSINPIIDMIRTATNVAGQIVVPVVVSRSEGLLDDEVLQAPSRPPLLEDTGEQPSPRPETPHRTATEPARA